MAHDVVGQELEDRRLQARHPGAKVVDLDVGQPLGPVATHEFGEVVDGLAREAAAGGIQGHHPALGIPGRAVEHLELDRGHQIADVGQFEGVAQVRLVAAVAAHGLIKGQHRKVAELDPLHRPEQAFDHALREVHDILLADEGGLDVDLGELRLAVMTQILVPVAAGDLVVAVHPGHHQQLLVDLR